MYHRFSNIIIGGDLRKIGYPQAVKCKSEQEQETKVNKNSIHRLVDVDIL